MKRVCFDAALAFADKLAAESEPGAPIRFATPGYLSHVSAQALMDEIAERHPGRCITVQSDAAGMQYGLVPSNAKIQA